MTLTEQAIARAKAIDEFIAKGGDFVVGPTRKARGWRCAPSRYNGKGPSAEARRRRAERLVITALDRKRSRQ